MLYRLWALVLLVSLFGLAAVQAAASPLSLQALQQAPYVPDRVLVKFRPGTAAVEREQAHARAGGRVIERFESIDVRLVQVPSGQVPAVVNLYARNPNVLYAEPDYYRLLRIPSEEPGPTPAGGGDYFAEQWYLHNIGQDHTRVETGLFGSQLRSTRGTAGADINAPEAWEASIGRPSLDLAATDTPKVAVLDSGADCNTLELQGKCLEQVNLVGLNAGSWGDACSAAEPACDNLGHGTFVSSEVGANTDNGEGIAGIGWQTGLGIFKVCYQELVTDGINLFLVGLCPVSGSIAAIEDATHDRFDADGVRIRTRYNVITMSYGSDAVDPVGNITPTTESNAECDAIAVAEQQGVLVVAAAGNNGDTGRVYPAACTDASGNSSVIAVAASDHHDDRAAFSTYSTSADPWVALAAPGEAVIGILPDVQCGLAPSVDSCVDWWDGTSMAAPLVAGAAALVWSDLYATQSGLGGPGACTLDGIACNQVVRQRLLNGAAATGAAGQDLLSWTRHGRLDVAAALVGTGAPPPEEAPLLAAFSYDCTGFVCRFDAGSSTGGGPRDYLWLFGDGGVSTEVAPVHDYGTAGRYTLTLTVFNQTQESSVSLTLSLKRSNRTLSGSVSADGGGGDTGGNCPAKKQERGQC
ncbi:S8 family serine peptidase [Marinobacterium weihaiense]|uniref:S8 family serine peptidase n=1 Tax=Marinobacterium weihaiense TaxID=2851016 RepID=A0ABS6MAF1_9GAMM|nr:S8 family serine peptidase [Marinobacterium weihaiense]MBV0932732.1 S8 family serine peptidase [Marinobacterium weihaiense]